MVMAREISDERLDEAGKLLAFVRGFGFRQKFEVMPNLENIVAATAMALGEHAPHAFDAGRASDAKSYSDADLPEGRGMRLAVARVVDMHDQSRTAFSGTADVMRRLAGDVLSQADAGGAEGGGANRDGGALITPGLERRIIGLAAVVDLVPEQARLHERNAVRAVANYSDFREPLFTPVLPEHEALAAALVSGERRPVGASEEGVVAHAALLSNWDILEVTKGRPHAEEIASNFRDFASAAYARELSSGAGRSGGMDSSIWAAARIEADVETVSNKSVEGAREKDWSTMSFKNQLEAHRQIWTAEGMSSLYFVQLATAAVEVSAGRLEIDRERGVVRHGIEDADVVGRRGSEMTAARSAATARQAGMTVGG
jgi:hypothetical protein